MRQISVPRRSVLQAMAAWPALMLAGQEQLSSGAGVKVAGGESRYGRPLKLPEGNPLFIKVSSEDSQGAFFLAEQPSGRRGGPPKHYHLDVDELFFCLAGEYVVEVGDQRYELRAGDMVFGPRRVPHAFAFVGSTPGRLLVGFTPAGPMEQFFRELDARGRYFGTGTDEDRRISREKYGIVNVGPPLTV